MPTTHVSLLERLRAPDDRTAWPEFVSIYAPLLMEFGRRLRLQESDSEDLTQKLLLVLLQRMPTFEYKHGKKFRGFLWTCFFNLARKRYAGHPTCPALLEAATVDSPIIEEKEFQEFVMARALQIMQCRFEEHVWKAFVETRLNGRSAREAGQSLGIPEANVWTYSSRVLAALREELAGLLE